MAEFQGTTVIVTGAGAGIGRSIARAFGERRAHVVIADIDRPAAQETADLITQQGGQALAIQVDVSQGAHARAMVARAVERYGRVDVLVNNAGIVTMTGFLDLTEQEWDRVLGVNLKAQFLCTQAFAKQVIAEGHGGAVINLGTVESEVVVASGEHCQPHYNASKGGVKMLTKAMALELAPYHIRVNGINPGPIATNFAGDSLQQESVRAFLLDRLLIKRIGEPSDIAGVAVFLASDQASYMTGTMVNVDGGWLVR